MSYLPCSYSIFSHFIAFLWISSWTVASSFFQSSGRHSVHFWQFQSHCLMPTTLSLMTKLKGPSSTWNFIHGAWCFTSEKVVNWVSYLPWAEFAQNSCQHSSSGTSPFFCVNGYHHKSCSFSNFTFTAAGAALVKDFSPDFGAQSRTNDQPLLPHRNMLLMLTIAQLQTSRLVTLLGCLQRTFILKCHHRNLLPGSSVLTKPFREFTPFLFVPGRQP